MGRPCKGRSGEDTADRGNALELLQLADELVELAKVPDLEVDMDLGEIGRHARVAVGCYSLPRNVPVEVEAIFEVK